MHEELAELAAGFVTKRAMSESKRAKFAERHKTFHRGSSFLAKVPGSCVSFAASSSLGFRISLFYI